MAIIYADNLQDSVINGVLTNDDALVGLQEDLSATFIFTLTAVTLSNAGDGDKLVCCFIPKGAKVLEWWLDVPALGGAKFELGDGTQLEDDTQSQAQAPNIIAASPARFAASDVVVAGTTPIASTQAGVPVAGSIPYTYLGDSVLVLTVTTGGTQSTGVIRGWLRYNMLGQAF